MKLGDNEVTANVIEVDTEHNVALLQIPLRNLPALPLGDSHKVQLAQQVRVIGYPLSDVLGSSIKVTSGSIAGIVEHEGQRLLQVNASINPGNSGGPVVNDRGEVVGVASAKLVGMEVSNVGFAVPVEEARRLLEKKGISIAAAEAGESLAGPELAKRVTPSVGLVTVTIGPGGVGTGKPYRLAFHGTREMTNHAKTDSAAASPEPKPQTFHGKVIADSHGEAQDVSGISTLPFGLGSQALVGIERLPEPGQEKWKVKRIIALTDVISTSPIPFRGAHTAGGRRSARARAGPADRSAPSAVGRVSGRPRNRPSWSFHSWKRSNTGCGASRPTGP